MVVLCKSSENSVFNAECGKGAYVELRPNQCTECRTCELICSLVYEGTCNPDRARISIGRNSITFKRECQPSCSLCAQWCPQEAIKLVKLNNREQ